MKLKFNRHLVLRCKVRDDKLLTAFIRHVKSLNGEFLELEEDSRRAVFKVKTGKITSLEEILRKYLKYGFYEVYSLSLRFRIDEKHLLRNLRGLSEAYSKVWGERKYRVAFIITVKNKPLSGELFRDRGAYRFKLRCLRSEISIKRLDPLLIPSSLYTFQYFPTTFKDEVLGKLAVLREGEYLLREILNTTLSF